MGLRRTRKWVQQQLIEEAHIISGWMISERAHRVIRVAKVPTVRQVASRVTIGAMKIFHKMPATLNRYLTTRASLKKKRSYWISWKQEKKAQSKMNSSLILSNLMRHPWVLPQRNPRLQRTAKHRTCLDSIEIVSEKMNRTRIFSPKNRATASTKIRGTTNKMMTLWMSSKMKNQQCQSLEISSSTKQR